MSKLVALQDIQKEFPDWPLTYWSTWQLIRKGDLKTIKLGRRHYVSRELLDECISRRTSTHFDAKGRSRKNAPDASTANGG